MKVTKGGQSDEKSHFFILIRYFLPNYRPGQLKPNSTVNQ